MPLKYSASSAPLRQIEPKIQTLLGLVAKTLDGSKAGPARPTYTRRHPWPFQCIMICPVCCSYSPIAQASFLAGAATLSSRLPGPTCDKYTLRQPGEVAPRTGLAPMPMTRVAPITVISNRNIRFKIAPTLVPSLP